MSNAIRRQLIVQFTLLALSLIFPLRLAIALENVPVISVYAASSLSQVLPRIANQWKAKTKSLTQIQFNFEASSRLARQIDSGAPADIFFSADENWMDFLQKRGKIIGTTRADLLSNEIVLIVPTNSPAQSQSKPLDVFDNPGLHRLALADPNVPVGHYAREALENLGILKKLKSRSLDIIGADSARSTLAWVARGEVDAGIVFQTDAKSEQKVRAVYRFDQATHSPIRYPVALLTPGKMSADLRSFFDYCKSPDSALLFKQFGFIWIGK